MCAHEVKCMWLDPRALIGIDQTPVLFNLR